MQKQIDAIVVMANAAAAEANAAIVAANTATVVADDALAKGEGNEESQRRHIKVSREIHEETRRQEMDSLHQRFLGEMARLPLQVVNLLEARMNQV